MWQILYKYIRNQLRRFFYFCHLLLEETLCFGSNFLVAYKVVVGVVFFLDGGTVENIGELCYEEVNRCSVADQVMRVNQENSSVIVDVILDNLKPHAGTVFQIEGAHKLFLISLKLVSGHGLDGYLEFEIRNRFLNDSVFIIAGKVAQNVRMHLNHLAYGIGKLLFVNLFRESECKRYIILNCIRISLALGKYTLLGET